VCPAAVRDRERRRALPRRALSGCGEPITLPLVGAEAARDGDGLGRRVAIVSPHLDDAVLSLGAAIARAVHAGAAVSVVTVFAGDPSSTAPPDGWARRCGFATAGAAYGARRSEDREALALLGASAEHLPLDGDAADAVILDAVRSAVGGSETVLIPGAPCTQPEHARVAELVVAHRPTARLGLYVDQPYAMWRLLGTPPAAGGGRFANFVRLALRLPSAARLQKPRLPSELASVGTVRWQTIPRSRREWRAKLRAVYRYRSQVRGFGPITVPGILLYEAAAGGEMIGWLERP
jgi:LmbE family N-acetylglucosaminyl deacetylase